MLMFNFVATLDNIPKSYNGPSDIDDSLIIGTAKGSKETFQTLYRCTASAVFGYLLSILRNKQDAEDAMQDTYVKILASAHSYTPCGKPMAWILTIAKNLALMKLRTRGRFSFTELEEIEDTLHIPSNSEQVLDNIVLKSALKILDDDSCQIVILHAVAGLKHRETAALMGLPLPTVLSKYTRSLAKLKKHLKEMG